MTQQADSAAARETRDAISRNYAYIVARSPLLRVVVGRDLRLLLASDPLLAQTGLTRRALASMRFEDLVTEDSAPGARAALLAGLEAGGIFTVEASLRRSGASAAPVIMSAAPLRDVAFTVPEEHRDGAILTVTPLEDSRVFRKALAARRAAERATAQKAKLLAQISHEVRTPMNIIMGYIQLARDGQVGAAEAKQLDTALSAAETLMKQMGDMLDLSRMDSGGLTLNAVAFNLAEELTRVAEQVGPRAQARGLDFRLELDPALPKAMTGDPVRAMQVVHNFLSNALKFTQSGHVALRAQVLEAREDGWRIRLEVEDTGRGVSQEDRERIFAAYARGEEEERAGTVEGWGLGLSICSAIARLMDAQVSLGGAEGEGATFRFDAPFARPEKETLRPLTAAEALAPPVHAPRPLQVLVVEDNRRNRFMLGEALARMGHAVSFAEHGAEAVEICAGRRFDVVLMDIRMPIMPGDEAAGRIKRSGLNRDTPIIAVTGNSRDDDGGSYGEAEFDSIMIKPVDLGALRAELDRLALALLPPEDGAS